MDRERRRVCAAARDTAFPVSAAVMGRPDLRSSPMSLTDAPTALASASCYAPVEATVAFAGRHTITRTQHLRHAGARRVRIAYEWQGPANAPVVLVAGGISAHRHAAANESHPETGWWETQVGAGKAIDTARFRVVAIDWLGSDGTLDVAIDSADQADAFAAVLDDLGIARAFAFVGCSYGAMVGLQFAARHGDRLGRLVAISGADRPHPYASAWRALQRSIVALGRSESASREALSLARQLAMLSYRTPEEFAERFDAPVRLHDGVARSASADYLESCGAKYVARTSPTAFLRLSESIDLHSVDARTITVPSVVVAVEDDRLVPVETLETLAADLGPRCRLERFRSPYGHDAFLTEPARIAAILAAALCGDAA
jgi:homoserine O-acetyltransferase/O-succinyltransferase